MSKSTKRILAAAISIVLVLAALLSFTSCEGLADFFGKGPATVDELNGKTVKDLYGASVNKYKNHKDDGVPYSVKLVWTKANAEDESVEISLSYNGNSLSYVITEKSGDISSSEEIVYLEGKMYYKDKGGEKHLHSTELSDVEKHLNNNTKLKDLLPALPHDLPESWFNDLVFTPTDDGEYTVEIDVDDKKSKEHPKYSDFYKSGVKCKIYFTEDGILDRIELNNVNVGGSDSNIVVSFSWENNGTVLEPTDKEDYTDKGDFDFDRGDKPGDDNTESDPPTNPGDGNGDGDDTDYNGDFKVGIKCPSYTLPLLDGSGSVNIKDFIGKKVVINCWGVWCGPCKQELPDFNRIASEYEDEVVILTVHSTYAKEEAPQYVAENFQGSKMIFACDLPLTEYIDLYFNLLGGTSYYPRTVILDENGIVTFECEGKQSYDNMLNYLNLCKHDWSYREIVPHTNDADGEYIKTCSMCNAEESFVGVIHNFTEWKPVFVEDHICTDATMYARECKSCGYIETKVNEGTEHVVDCWEVDTNPTFATEGRLTGVCAVCATTVDYTLPTLDSPRYMVEILDPTCTENGYAIYSYEDTDKNIDWEVTIIFMAQGHQLAGKNYLDWNINYGGTEIIVPYWKPDSADVNGVLEPLGVMEFDNMPIDCEMTAPAYFNCKECMEQITVLTYKGHNGPNVIISEPTCTSEGAITTRCNLCEMDVNAIPIPPIEHSFHYTLEMIDESTFMLYGECVGCFDCSIVQEIPAENVRYEIECYPTCTFEGLMNYFYVIDGIHYCVSVTIPKTGHVLNGWREEKYETITSDIPGICRFANTPDVAVGDVFEGYYVCMECADMIYTKVVCTEEASNENTCSGHILAGKPVDSYGTIYSNTVGVMYFYNTCDVECGQFTPAYFFCERCEDYVLITVEKAHYLSVDPVRYDEATCNSNRIEYYECYNCEALVAFEVENTKGHKMNASITQNADGTFNLTLSCMYCDYFEVKSNVEQVESVIMEPATCYKNGTIKYTYILDGVSYTVLTSIPKVSHMLNGLHVDSNEFVAKYVNPNNGAIYSSTPGICVPANPANSCGNIVVGHYKCESCEGMVFAGENIYLEHQPYIDGVTEVYRSENAIDNSWEEYYVCDACGEEVTLRTGKIEE